MVPDYRDFDKDSKKYLFSILGFFYEFLLILQIHSKNLKTNLILCLSPWICRKPPRKIWGLTFWPLAGKQRRGAAWPAGSGELRSPAARESRGRGTRKGRGTLGGARVESRQTESGRPWSSAPGGDGGRWRQYASGARRRRPD